MPQPLPPLTDTKKLLNRVRLLVERGERPDRADIEALFGVSDLVALARLARIPRERRHGRVAHLRNAVRVDLGPFGEIDSTESGGTLITLHAAGPLDLDGWSERIRHAVAAHPGAALSLSPAFVDAMASSGGGSVEDLLERLAMYGPLIVDGTGAELFDREWRARYAPEAIDPERWLDIHRAAHRRGVPGIAAMAHGTVDHPAAMTDHLLRLRSVQEETGGFVAFVPTAIHNSAASAFYLAAPTAVQTLRTTAIARLVLDNIPHISAAPALVGQEIATVALSYGADTLDPTITAGDIAAEEFSHQPDPDVALPVVTAGTTEARRTSSLEKLRARIVEARFPVVELDACYAPGESTKTTSS